MPKRVLLCDDEIHILRAAEFKIKRAGYSVRTAGDGEEAWQLVQDQTPDLLITDCQMPRLDGLGLVRRMRDDVRTASVPVLMLTAKGYELSHEILAAELGVIDIIAKPFSPRDLLKRVDAILAEETAEVAG
ncbi:MAG: response regulator [Patescibacteria group bacterium]|nr:response regulator [Patescibacteria group bacterium]